MGDHLLAIDQGTTSTRAMVFDSALQPLATAQQGFAQHFPRPGWIEHDPEDLRETALSTMRDALAQSGLGWERIAAIGITNQRETTLVWDRQSGKPLHRAIVWQDRRTADRCRKLCDQGAEDLVRARTGLLLDPYFSATKIGWILDHVDGARAAAERGTLAFGTVDSFLLWCLTGGRVHATDATNASRTMLYDIHRGDWCDELLALFGVPRAMLPDVRDCSADFGTADESLCCGAVPITGIAGDQQAAAIGQACFEPGMTKATYGTGAFLLRNTGTTPVASEHRLLTTVACQLDGHRTYALEGSIFIAGAAVQWLRDGLGILGEAAEADRLAEQSDPGQQVYLVPAFTGLGAPHWDPDCRGALYGLTRGTSRKEVARAALESVCFQTRDLLEAMDRDWPSAGERIMRVDGGVAASDWTMQRLADILGAPVDRPGITETTALGAAWLAGSGAGICPGRAGFSKSWQQDRRFTPELPDGTRAEMVRGWKDAVRRTLG